MNTPSKPAASGTEISDFKPLSKNTVHAAFDVTLPSGMIVRSVLLHERDGRRWVSLPAKEWTNASGERQFTPIVEFTSRTVADRFRDTVLEALDRYLVAEEEEVR
jgi:hypothetical protein